MGSGVVHLDLPFLAEVLELKANELRAIVGDNHFWNAEAAYDILPNKVLKLAVTELMEGLSFDPLGEVVGDREHVNPLARGCWEFANNVAVNHYVTTLGVSTERRSPFLLSSRDHR